MGGGSRWAETGRMGRGKNRVTRAASVRLLGLFAHRFFRHHEPQALLLSVPGCEINYLITRCVARAVGGDNLRQGAEAARLLRRFLDHRRLQALLLRGGWGRQGGGCIRGASHVHAVFE